MECTSPDRAPLRALASHRGISNKTRWAAAAFFPEKAHRAQLRGTAPLSTCPPALSPRRLLVQQHFAFCGAAAGQNQQTEFSFFSAPLTPVSPHPPEAARESAVFFFSKKLDKSLQQVPGISAHFRHSDAEAFVLHVDKHDSVYSQCRNWSLRHNELWLQWGHLHSCSTANKPSGTKL